MQHRVPDDEVEGVVVVGNALSVGDPAVDLQAEVLAVAGGHLDHARRQIRHRAAPGDACLNQVEQEKSASAAQFQRPVVRQIAQFLGGHGRVEQVAGVVDAALVVADRPLVVVALGLPVVVQHLRELGVVAGRFNLFRGRVRIRGSGRYSS